MSETSPATFEKSTDPPLPSVPNPTPPPGDRGQANGASVVGRFAEFFAGIGLVREAIEPLGWRCVFANDISPRKEEMYRRRFGDEDFRLGDIHDLGVGDLPAHLDLVTAAFPCIDLSLAGNRAGLAGRHSGTIWPFLDLVTALCIRRAPPAAVLLENVTGFLTSRGGADLADVCRRLAAVHYDIDVLVVDARWFRPQSRPRLFVAARQHDPERPRPRAGAEPSKLRPPRCVASKRLTPSCRSSTSRCRRRRARRSTLSRRSWRIFLRTTSGGGPKIGPPPWSRGWRLGIADA